MLTLKHDPLFQLCNLTPRRRSFICNLIFLEAEEVLDESDRGYRTAAEMAYRRDMAAKADDYNIPDSMSVDYHEIDRAARETPYANEEYEIGGAGCKQPLDPAIIDHPLLRWLWPTSSSRNARTSVPNLLLVALEELARIYRGPQRVTVTADPVDYEAHMKPCEYHLGSIFAVLGRRLNIVVNSAGKLVDWNRDARPITFSFGNGSTGKSPIGSMSACLALNGMLMPINLLGCGKTIRPSIAFKYTPPCRSRHCVGEPFPTPALAGTADDSVSLIEIPGCVPNCSDGSPGFQRYEVEQDALRNTFGYQRSGVYRLPEGTVNMTEVDVQRFLNMYQYMFLYHCGSVSPAIFMPVAVQKFVCTMPESALTVAQCAGLNYLVNVTDSAKHVYAAKECDAESCCDEKEPRPLYTPILRRGGCGCITDDQMPQCRHLT